MKISEEKKQKISEQILAFLFDKNPQPQFTYHISKEIARDEEFVKKILHELREKKLVVDIRTNKEGTPYSRRIRWKLKPRIYEAYRLKQ